MKIYKGTTGLDKSFQDAFNATNTCRNCGKIAEIIFVAQEQDEEKGHYICNLYKPKGEGTLWLHDACAVAVYLCPFCLMATAEINQA